MITIAWFMAMVTFTVSFIVSQQLETRPGRVYSPYDFAHFTMLTLGVLLIERAVRAFPLTRPHLFAKILLHACFASGISLLAGLASSFVMGFFDHLHGVRHLINTVIWFTTPDRGRARLFVIEQLFYFGTAALFEFQRRAALHRASELRAATLEADLSRIELSSSREQLPPAYLQEVFQSLRDLVDADPARAERLINRFARFLRESIDAAARPELSDRDELRVIVAFLAVESERRGSPIDVDCVEAASSDDQRAALTLAPRLIGARERLKAASRVRIYHDGDELAFVVDQETGAA
ncbi:MAG: histidine kinase [Thermoanaerobaculia bacterium]